MIEVSDTDRNECGFFKRAKEFENELGAKYRKPLLLLSVFSLIYNFAGIKITGSGVGILSGSVTNPSVIGYALLAALIYSLCVYLSVLWVRHEDYYLSVTDLGNKNRFEQSLVQHLIENKIRIFLKNKNVDLSRVQFHNYDKAKLKHKFELHGVEKYTTGQIFDMLKEINAEPHKDKSLKSDHIYVWPYSLSDEDLEFFKRHFKYLKLVHLRNFIEYRMPYMLAILAVYSFWL
jgi:hypothetical protein